MRPLRSVSVSELKNTLLEVVRRVQKGEAFEITKGGEPVALLSPRGASGRPATGFARVEIRGSLDLPPFEWGHDAENLGPRKRKARR